MVVLTMSATGLFGLDSVRSSVPSEKSVEHLSGPNLFTGFWDKAGIF